MIRFYHGFFFPVLSRIFCGLLLIASFFVIPQFPLFGIFLMLFFGLAFAVHKGIEFDLQKNKFRSYTTVYGIRFGEWLNLVNYPHLCLLQRHYSKGPIYNRYSVYDDVYERNEGSFDPDYSRIEIIITGNDFRKKILVKTEKTEELGRREAERIAQLLGVSFVNYAPKRHPDNPRRKRKTI
jgi:hypothetical protein